MFALRHATIDDAPAVAELLARGRKADGRSPLSEFKALRVPVANAVRTLVAPTSGGELTALAVAAWHPEELGEDDGYWAAELVIDPVQRSTAAYLDLIRGLTRDLNTEPSIWTFDATQAEAAEAAGMTSVRTVLEMKRDLPAATTRLPAGYSLRSFQPGSDEGEWLALNQRVFAHHPEAGSIDGADLALRMAQPWFDPDGLLLLDDGAGPVGYCWTKLHSADIGEIYMVGLVPEARGRGLSKPLTGAGLDYLSSSGASHVILYAEAANQTAVGLYESMGFVIVRRVTLYAPGPT